MEIRLTLRPGMSGEKKLLARYGERLICVRYRYDRASGRRVKTAELIVEDVAWAGRARKPRRNDSDLVGVRIAWKETELRASVKRAGGNRCASAFLRFTTTALVVFGNGSSRSRRNKSPRSTPS